MVLDQTTKPAQTRSKGSPWTLATVGALAIVVAIGAGLVDLDRPDVLAFLAAGIGSVAGTYGVMNDQRQVWRLVAGVAGLFNLIWVALALYLLFVGRSIL